MQSLLKDAWRQPEATTIWLFLFDNLDLALACDLVPDPKKLIGEIEDFLSSIDLIKARAVITGRRRLTEEYGQVDALFLELLDQAQQRRLLAGTPMMAELPGMTADKSIRPYLGSPGWLRLVADAFPPPTAEGPDGQYALMTDLVRYRLHAAGLDGGLEALQALLPPPGGGISRCVSAGDATAAIAARTGRTAEEAERIVDALRRAGLVSVRRLGDRTGAVEFSDDAIAVYLQARRRLDSPGPLQLSDLGKDTWMVVVLVMRGAGGDRVTPLIDEVVTRVGTLVGSQELDEAGARAAVNLLSVIDAGLQYRPALIGEDLRRQAGDLIRMLTDSGNTGLLTRLLSLSTVVPAEDAVVGYHEQLTSGDGAVVAETAARIVTSRASLDEIEWPCRFMLLTIVAVAGLPRLTMSAPQAAPTEPDRRLRLASTVGDAIVVMFTIVYGAGAGLEFFGHRDAWGLQSFQFAIFAVVVGCLAQARRSSGFRNYVFAHIAEVALSLAGMAFVAVFALGATLIVAFIAFDLNLVWVLLVAVLAWPYAALAYLTEDRAPTVGRLVFPYPWVIEPTWREIISDT